MGGSDYTPAFIAPNTDRDEKLQRAIRAAIEDMGIMIGRPFGLPTAGVKSATCNAQLSATTLIDPSSAAMSVILPPVTQQDRGKIVVIKNHSDSLNQISIYPAKPTGKIDGLSSLQSSVGRNHLVLQVIGVDEWITTVGVNRLSWNYLNNITPAGAAYPLAVWQFDGTANSLTDRSGNGNDLTLIAGDQFYVSYPLDTLPGYMVGLGFKEAESYGPADSSPFLIPGELTIEVVIAFEGNTSASDTIVDFAKSGENPEDNRLYYFYVAANDGHLAYQSEHDSGIDDDVDFDSYCYPGQLQHLILTRNGGVGGTTTFRLGQNGALIDEQTENTPTDGDDSSFRLGRSALATNPLNGVIFSVRIVEDYYSEDQILESYRRVRGIIA